MKGFLDHLRSLWAFARHAARGNSVLATSNAGRAYRPPGIVEWAEIDRYAKPEYENDPTPIEALVSSGGVAIWNDPEFDVQTCRLSAWRLLGEPIRESEMYLLVPLPAGAKETVDLPQWSTWRMNVVLSKERDRAVLVSWEPLAADAAFRRVERQLRRPVTVRDVRLGTLALNRDLKLFLGETTWNSRIVRVSVHTDAAGSPDPARATAEHLWVDMASWTRRVQEFAVDSLLDDANGWLKVDAAKHTREDFLSRMTLNSISLSPEGQFEFWYGDGDLFGGHSICVRGNVANGPQDASIEG